MGCAGPPCPCCPGPRPTPAERWRGGCRQAWSGGHPCAGDRELVAISRALRRCAEGAERRRSAGTGFSGRDLHPALCLPRGPRGGGGMARLWAGRQDGGRGGEPVERGSPSAPGAWGLLVGKTRPRRGRRGGGRGRERERKRTREREDEGENFIRTHWRAAVGPRAFTTTTRCATLRRRLRPLRRRRLRPQLLPRAPASRHIARPPARPPFPNHRHLPLAYLQRLPVPAEVTAAAIASPSVNAHASSSPPGPSIAATSPRH